MKPEECNTTQKSETPKHEEEIKSPRKDEEVSQQTPNGQGQVVEVELLKEPEPLKSGMLGDTSACRQVEDEGKIVFSTDKDSKSDRNISPGRDPGFDLASPVDSLHINTPEAIMAQIDEVLSETGQVSPAQTRETVNRIAVMKTE